MRRHHRDTDMPPSGGASRQAPRGLLRPLAWVFAAVTVLVLTCGVALAAAISQLNGALDEGRATQRVGQAVTGVRVTVAEMEASVLTYAATGGRGELAAADRAAATIAARASELRAASEDTRFAAPSAAIAAEAERVVRLYASTLRASPAATTSAVRAADPRRQSLALQRTATAMRSELVVEAEDARQRAVSGSRRADAVLALSGASILLILGGLAWILASRVLRPVEDLEVAAARIGAGNYGVRVEPAGVLEMRNLGTRFNAMATSLQHASERSTLFTRIAELLGATDGVAERSSALLGELADALGAPVGVVYASRANGRPMTLACSRSLDDPPATLEQAGGLARRACEQDEVVVAAHEEGDLVVAGLGGRSSLRHELHVPLRAGGMPIGVLSLGRTDDRPFDAEEINAVESICEHASALLAAAMEAATRRRTTALQRAVLDASGEAIAFFDATGRAAFVNDAMRRLALVLELPPASDVEGFASHLDALGDGTPQLAGMLELVRTEARAIEEELTLGERSYRVYAAPVTESGSGIVGSLVALRDVTELRTARRIKEELVTTVSHELRTPLAAILGFTDLLRTRDLSDDERAEHVGIVHAQAVRLQELVDDFLDLRSLERSGRSRRVAGLHVADLVADQAAVFRGQSPVHEIRVVIADPDLVVEADPGAIRRAVANLIGNAIKYSPEGGEVRIDVRADGPEVEISVRDQGIGVPAAEHERVFERFHRADHAAVRSISGTGLGLALVRETAQAHGGTVGVESEEGAGARFWLRLPLTAAAHRTLVR